MHDTQNRRENQLDLTVALEEPIDLLQRHVGNVILHVEVHHNQRRVQKHMRYV